MLNTTVCCILLLLRCWTLQLRVHNYNKCAATTSTLLQRSHYYSDRGCTTAQTDALLPQHWTYHNFNDEYTLATMPDTCHIYYTCGCTAAIATQRCLGKICMVPIDTYETPLCRATYLTRHRKASTTPIVQCSLWRIAMLKSVRNEPSSSLPGKFALVISRT